MTRANQIATAQDKLATVLNGAGNSKSKAKAIFRLTRKYKITGLVLWRGKSEIDHKTPVVSIAQINPQYNDKIGKMIQIFYLVNTELKPVDVAKNGIDVGICGDCKHRKVNLGSCYVTLFQGVRSLHEAYLKNSYFDLTRHSSIAIELIKLLNMPVRFGAYGDPAAMPFDLQYRIAKAVDFKITAYTHQWQDERFANFKEFCHASVDSEQEKFDAIAAGWNYYLVSPCASALTGKVIEYDKAKSELKMLQVSGEVICPNTASQGIVSCADCLKCSGISKNGRPILNAIHGARVKRYVEKYS